MAMARAGSAGVGVEDAEVVGEACAGDAGGTGVGACTGTGVDEVGADAERWV